MTLGGFQRICAWCNQALDEFSGSERDPRPISHGICEGCMVDFKKDDVLDLETFLDQLPGPVLLVDENARVLTANQAAQELIGKSAVQVSNQLGGDVFDCAHARRPGGCGKTIHCKSCTIRLTVTDTQLHGESHVRVPATLDLHTGTRSQEVKFLISTEKSDGRVFLRIDEVNDEQTHPSKTDPCKNSPSMG